MYFTWVQGKTSLFITLDLFKICKTVLETGQCWFFIGSPVSNPFFMVFVAVPSVPTVIFIFHNPFSSQVFIHFSLYFHFTLWSSGMIMSICRRVLFFLLSDFWADIEWSFLSQNLRCCILTFDSMLIMVGWLFGFMAYQPLKFIKCQIHFYTSNQFYFKQFNLAWVHSLIVKKSSISSYSVLANSSNSNNSV